MIPKEVPRNLRRNAIYPNPDSEEDPAWTPPDALKVISALDWSRVAVEEVQGYKQIAADLVAADHYWSMYPTFGETESSRARKSRAAAIAFIGELDESEVDYVGLNFSYQDEAA